MRALQKKKHDDVLVPTYGMHILPEYFPNRELGMTYYKLQEFDNAIKHLAISLNQHESDKAKYYLNLARKEKINLMQKDTESPYIQTDNYAPIVNQPTHIISGEVYDNTFVATIFITINNKKTISLMDVSAPFSQRFDKEVPLESGLNHISIKAFDLFDNTSEKQISIIMDQECPIVTITGLDSNHSIDNSPVEGFLYDPSEIALFTINNNQVDLIPSIIENDQYSVVSRVIYAFSYSPTPLERKKGILEYRAEDSQHNSTHGTIECPDIYLIEKRRRGKAIISGSLKLAMADQTTAREILMTASNGHQGTQQENPSLVQISIAINAPETFEEEIYPQITIESLIKIKKIEINNQEILSVYSSGADIGKLFLSILERFLKGKKNILSFPAKVRLENGDNPIKVKVIDQSGNPWSKTVTVCKKQRQIDMPHNRWKMALPVICHSSQNTSRECDRDEWCQQLHAVFNDQKRFNFEDLKGWRLPIVLSKTDFDNKPYNDIEGEFLPPLEKNEIEVYLCCYIEENRENTTIRAWIIDVETRDRLGTEDTFCVSEEIIIPGYEKIKWP